MFNGELRYQYFIPWFILAQVDIHCIWRCFAWFEIIWPSLHFPFCFGTYRSRFVAYFRRSYLRRHSVSVSNTDPSQSFAESTSNIRASVPLQLRILPCIRFVSPMHWWICYNPLPADNWNQFHMSWHKSLMGGIWVHWHRWICDQNELVQIGIRISSNVEKRKY